MVNALNPQNIQSTPDVSWRPLFTRMRHQPEVKCTRFGKHLGEFLGRVPKLARCQANTDQFVPQRQGLLQRFKSLRLAQMAQEAQNQ